MGLVSDSLYETNPAFREMTDLSEKLRNHFGGEKFNEIFPEPPYGEKANGVDYVTARLIQLNAHKHKLG